MIALARRGAGRWVIRPRWGAQAGTIALLGLVASLVVAPVGVLAWATLRSEAGAGLSAVTRALAGPGAAEVVRNTALFTIGSALVAAVSGTSLAYLYTRTDVPLRKLLVAAALVPLAVPGLLYAFAFTLLASPRMGAAAGLLGALPGPPLDPFSLGGMIAVEGLHLSPIAFLIMVASFRSMDPALEEAAVLSGGSRLSVLRRISLPLVRPGLLTTLLLVGLRAIEGFEVPALLGLPSRVPVLTTRLFGLLRGFPPDPAAAGAVGLLLVAIATVGLVVQHRLLRGTDRFEVLTGRRRSVTPLPLGRWRVVAGAGVAAWFTLAAAAPLGILAWASTQPFYRAPSLEATTSVSLDNYRELLGDRTFPEALIRSLSLGVMAATVTVVLGCLIGWVVVRTSARGRLALDTVSLAPLVLPGLVLGLAIGFMWLRLPGGLYGTSVVLLIAYVTAFLPYGVRYAAAALSGLGGELEEAGRVAGASWWATLRRVVMPLAGPGLAAAWLSIVVLALRELSISLLLYQPGREVVPVLFWELWEDGRLPQIATLGLLLIVVLSVVLSASYLLARRVVLPALD